MSTATVTTTAPAGTFTGLGESGIRQFLGVRYAAAPVGEWRFKPLSDEACKVELELDYEFAAGVLAMALKPVFATVCDRMVDAFLKRADQILVQRDR